MTLTDIFLDIENRRDMLNRHVDGYYFWAYNRNAIYGAYRRNEKGHTIAHESLPGKQQILSYCHNIINTIKGYRILSKLKKSEGKAIFVLAHPRRTLINGLYYSIYTDLIIPDSWNVYTFEKTDYYSHHKPAASKNLVYLDWIELKSKLVFLFQKRFCKAKFRSFYNKISEMIKPILDELTQISRIEVDQEKLICSIVSHYYVVNESLKFWEMLLSHNKVSSIVEVVGYDLFIMAANQKAKEYNIPIVEMQHGMLSSIHIAYQYHKDAKPFLTPDYIFTFSDYWSKEINIPNTKTIPIGFEFFNQQRTRHEKQKAHRNITIISQGNVGQILSKIALEVANEIKNQNKDIVVYYKLHPGEFNSAKEWYPGLFEHDAIKVISNEMNIYDLFAVSCVQIGYNSTALFEGFGYNLKTFLIEDGDPLMQKLISKTIANKYETARLVVESIGEELESGIECDIWTSNSKARFANAIELINRNYE